MPFLFSRKGFSLIELMIVISIISILSLIAIPSYQQYTKRARFAEVIAIAQTFKLAVSIALQQGSNLSEIVLGSNGIPTSPNPSKNFDNIKIYNGTITATATELANSATIIFKPNFDGSQWTLSGTCLKLGLCSS